VQEPISNHTSSHSTGHIYLYFFMFHFRRSLIIMTLVINNIIKPTLFKVLFLLCHKFPSLNYKQIIQSKTSKRFFCPWVLFNWKTCDLQTKSLTDLIYTILLRFSFDSWLQYKVRGNSCVFVFPPFNLNSEHPKILRNYAIIKRKIGISLSKQILDILHDQSNRSQPWLCITCLWNQQNIQIQGQITKNRDP
jgi:hypothetical protein